MKEMSLEEKVQRALDYQEIQNVMAGHSYCYEAQRQFEEIERFWSKRDDIAYGSQHMGRKAVIEYYCETNEWMRQEKLKLMNRMFPEIENVKENEGIGDMVVHLLTTPYIEIAADGQTAQGIWYVPSINLEIGRDGEPVPMTIWEKDKADFIKEDGKWKIWHFSQWPLFSAPIDKSYFDGSKSGPGRTFSKGPMPTPEQMRQGMSGPEPYSARRIAQFIPELPEPYDTWDDSMSSIL